MNKIDLKKLMWNYMLKNGCLTKNEWDHYGSDWEGRYTTTRKQWNDFILKLKSVGVDWEKTELPKSDIHHYFNGTENDAGRAETLLGTIILNSGDEYIIGVGNAYMNFSNYILGLASMIDEFNSDPFCFNVVFD